MTVNAPVSVNTISSTPNLGALKNKSLESIVNRWVSHLEKQIHQFHQQANQVAEWDKMLMSNAEQINLLHNEIEKMQTSQQDLDKKLDLICTKQQDLSGRLTNLETEVEKLNENVVMNPPTPADKKREQSYELAQKLQQQLEAMKNGTLKELIEKINASQAVDEDNEVGQITQILNEHYNQLEWIESQYQKLSLKAKEVEKIAKEQKQMAEQTFRGRK
jgi:methyl-accepting chemotaxis protein